MGQIYLVRHGQASFGAADYDQLSELGLAQSRALGAWFNELRLPFSHVVSGELKRQRQTAQACMAMLAEDLQPSGPWQDDPAFNEYDHREVLVRQRPEFADPAAVERFLVHSSNPRAAFQDVFAAAMSRWMSGRHDGEYSETWLQFRARCVDGLRRLTERPGRAQSMIVFTSGGVIATLCQHVLGMGDRETARLNWGLVNCGVTRLLFQPGQVSLNYLNNHAHLERLGQAHAVTYR